MSISQDQKQLVRMVAAGSVDDGKSTMIGRLLYDSDSVSKDQLEAAKQASKRRGLDSLDLSLLTDGLAAEREQGITIDVAYRFFFLDKRDFIIADVPGHEQYTRNMVTGASTADIGVILVDASKGLTEQSKRHISVASLLGIPHISIIVNKMDKENYSKEVFENIKDEVTEFTAKLSIQDLQYIPISALKGDMVVDRNENMDWYNGPTLFSYLKNIPVTPDRNLVDFRFPVQSVIKEGGNRWYAGKVASGAIKKGEEVVVLPSKKKSKITDINLKGESIEEANIPQSVSVSLEDELDVSRGDMISRVGNQPIVSKNFKARLCWMDEDKMDTQKTYLLKQTSRTVRCNINLDYRLNINTLHREEVDQLHLNDIGKISVSAHQPIMFDSYEKNRSTGSFILIDSKTKDTVAAGMIIQQIEDSEEVLNLNQGAVLWFTGLSGSGKSTIADKVYEKLKQSDIDSERLDGDILRNSPISRELEFTKEDRDKNIDRAGYIAKLLSRNNTLVLSSFISPFEKKRSQLDENIDNLIEVFVDAPLEVCEQRDVKGLYEKAREGEIENFTGISSPYEEPQSPNIHLKTNEESVEECVNKVIKYLKDNNYLL